ncbi:MAG: aminodeoxychorismate synthase component I [Thiotrichaceae bacterium]
MFSQLNELGQQRIPFFFVINFACNNFYLQPLAELSNEVFFDFDGFQHLEATHDPSTIVIQQPIIEQPIDLKSYHSAFQHTQNYMRDGHTYLLNLTFPTKIMLQNSLLEIFTASQAKFKLYFKNQFVVFSPERFVRVTHNVIKTYPMKGTINAMLPDAAQKILANTKEMAEHTMVVDLLRNDLSRIATKVRVEKFRYLDKIQAGNKMLLQVSSEISGQLENHWQNRLGNILAQLLPAGSISGTPKKRTLEIIQQVEDYDRGFFTGIFGYFDGENLDSAVLIRFIEQQDNQFFYKSGGGLTIDSNLCEEYQEMLAKIYIPIGFSKKDAKTLRND